MQFIAPLTQFAPLKHPQFIGRHVRSLHFGKFSRSSNRVVKPSASSRRDRSESFWGVIGEVLNMIEYLHMDILHALRY